MSYENETSPPTLTNKSSSNSSPNVDLDFLEKPLEGLTMVGLLPKDPKTMTEEELREFVRDNRTLRTSAQTLKSRLAGPKEEKPVKLDNMGEYL